MAANERQVGGDHYQTGDLQHWDVVVKFDLDYFQGQITRYLFRWRAKGGLQDLDKAMHFLEKYKEVAAKETLDKTLAAAEAAIASEFEERGRPFTPWRVEQQGEHLVATHASKVGPSEKVARKKVRSSRKR